MRMAHHPHTTRTPHPQPHPHPLALDGPGRTWTDPDGPPETWTDPDRPGCIPTDQMDPDSPKIHSPEWLTIVQNKASNTLFWIIYHYRPLLSKAFWTVILYFNILSSIGLVHWVEPIAQFRRGVYTHTIIRVMRLFLVITTILADFGYTIWNSLDEKYKVSWNIYYEITLWLLYFVINNMKYF